jgi:hypothetical protein
MRLGIPCRYNTFTQITALAAGRKDALYLEYQGRGACHALSLRAPPFTDTNLLAMASLERSIEGENRC